MRNHWNILLSKQNATADWLFNVRLKWKSSTEVRMIIKMMYFFLFARTGTYICRLECYVYYNNIHRRCQWCCWWWYTILFLAISNTSIHASLCVHAAQRIHIPTAREHTKMTTIEFLVVFFRLHTVYET